MGNKKQQFSFEFFEQLPVVGVFRGFTPDECFAVAEIMANSGFRTLEVTMNNPDALKIISGLKWEYKNVNVGVGTVCNMDELSLALEAGAQFVTTPVIDEEVIKACVSSNIPVFPGAYTPSEIYKAWSLGATAVKIFPATQLGPTYIRDVLKPLSGLRMIPTGGVNIENLSDYMAAGAYGVGMGRPLVIPELVKNKDFESLKKHFEAVKEIMLHHKEMLPQ